MEKEEIRKDEIVQRLPEGVLYLSQWEDFNLTNYPRIAILDKGYSGCGFVNYCLDYSEKPIILLAINSEVRENQRVLPHVNRILIVESDTDNIDILNFLKDDGKKIVTCIEDYQRVVDILVNVLFYPKFTLVIDRFEEVMNDETFREKIKQSFNTILSYTSTVSSEEKVRSDEYFKTIPYYRLDWTSNIEIICNNNFLNQWIKLSFNNGNTYTYEKIKQTIQDIYNKSGLEKYKVKAQDIKKWFEVKGTTVKDSAGKSKRAFIIVSRK